jgi:hypothetical protein
MGTLITVEKKDTRKKINKNWKIQEFSEGNTQL